MPLAVKISDARASLSRRRAERIARRQLSAELATFASAADRIELDVLLDRHDSEETREIRAILLRQDAGRH
jgi:hypothetical protein